MITGPQPTGCEFLFITDAIEQALRQPVVAYGSVLTFNIIEEQMRMMGGSRYGERANMAEVFADTLDPAIAQRMQEVFKQDPNSSIAAQGRSVAEVLGNLNLEFQSYIIANSRDPHGWIPGSPPYVASTNKGPLSISNTPPHQHTARYGNADVDCKAGVQRNMTPQEMADRRNNAADGASTVSTQSGRFAAAATAYGTALVNSPTPADKAGGTVQFGLAATVTAAGVGAQVPFFSLSRQTAVISEQGAKLFLQAKGSGI